MLPTSPKKWSLLEKIVVKHAHPVTFVFHLLALLWGSYFLWGNRLVPAVLSSVLLALVGHLLGGFDKNYKAVVGSELNLFQRLMLYHFDAVSLLVHYLAFAIYIFGMWTHSTWALLSAVTVSLLGYVIPWLRHGQAEAKYELAIGDDR
jgi:hypothetical protein